ncbi:hypothetical protein HK102_004174 [Quaeritorhiza haematococci]|nr:hypothetical protein HK102_004174 [Quaeritorhiza haematococci]
MSQSIARSAEEFLTAPTAQLHSEISRLRSSSNDEGVTEIDKSNNRLKSLMEPEDDQGMRHFKARSFAMDASQCVQVQKHQRLSGHSRARRFRLLSDQGRQRNRWCRQPKAIPATVMWAKGSQESDGAAGLNQKAKFPSSILTKDGASGSPGKKRITKFLRKVSFDAPTMILNICHFGDPVDNVSLPTLRAALGLPMADSTSTDEDADGGEANTSEKKTDLLAWAHMRRTSRWTWTW